MIVNLSTTQNEYPILARIKFYTKVNKMANSFTPTAKKDKASFENVLSDPSQDPPQPVAEPRPKKKVKPKKE
jgi:hypothetical protein